MGLQELLEKYDKDMRTGDNWFTLKKEENAACEGCLFNTDDPKHCLIYPAEKDMEKPQECKHKRTFKGE